MADYFLSEEDKALFREMMRTVKPLGKTNKAVIDAAPSGKRQNSLSSGNGYSHYDLSDYYSDPVDADTLLSYCKACVPAKRFTQLKRGQFPWQARLDLHGLRSESASAALCQFIEQQSLNGHRTLLIIHGKGGKHGEAPILKNRVNQWLRQLPQVLAFHSAIARDGGSGALYVLLKRNRERDFF